MLGYAGEVPPRMAASIDVERVLEKRPGRVFELTPALGLGSAFESEHGYYLDPISPRVATLPSAWEARPCASSWSSSFVAWFLEPARRRRLEVRADGAARPGVDSPRLRARVLSLAILDARFAQTSFVDAAESERARKALDEDRQWLRVRAAARSAETATRRSGPAAPCGGSTSPAWAAFQT